MDVTYDVDAHEIQEDPSLDSFLQACSLELMRADPSQPTESLLYWSCDLNDNNPNVQDIRQSLNDSQNFIPSASNSLIGYTPATFEYVQSIKSSTSQPSALLSTAVLFQTDHPDLFNPVSSALHHEIEDGSSILSSSIAKETSSQPESIGSDMERISRPTAKAWLDVKPYLLKLYITDELPLHQVVARLKKDYAFHVTENMCKKRLKEWGISKNMSKRDKTAILASPAHFKKQSASSRRKTLRFARDNASAVQFDSAELHELIHQERTIRQTECAPHLSSKLRELDLATRKMTDEEKHHTVQNKDRTNGYLESPSGRRSVDTELNRRTDSQIS